jgi:hypothetical protein
LGAGRCQKPPAPVLVLKRCPMRAAGERCEPPGSAPRQIFTRTGRRCRHCGQQAPLNGLAAKWPRRRAMARDGSSIATISSAGVGRPIIETGGPIGRRMINRLMMRLYAVRPYNGRLHNERPPDRRRRSSPENLATRSADRFVDRIFSADS